MVSKSNPLNNLYYIKSDFIDNAKAHLISHKNNNHALIYTDIKSFKFINCYYGYKQGDDLLRYFEQSISEIQKEGESFLKLYADSYVFMLCYNDLDELFDRMNSLNKKMQHYSYLTDNKIKAEICSGIYLIEESVDEIDFRVVIDKANIAQKSIKENQGNNYTLFSDETYQTFINTLDIQSNMYDALKRNDFIIYFQPQVDIINGNKVLGAEALVRWNRKNIGIVSPNVFIPVFEKNGFIVNLDLYVYEKVCLYISERIREGKALFKISVNVSRISMLDEMFVENYIKIKERYNIPDGIIELECTESSVFKDFYLIKAVIKKLRENGIRWAMDDFGTGYSSLSVLKNMTIDVIKLDMEFFKQGENLIKDLTIISSIVEMAQRLNLSIVAEGVETADQVEFLKDVGCDIVQGYYFSKPLAIIDFENDILTQVCLN